MLKYVTVEKNKRVRMTSEDSKQKTEAAATGAHGDLGETLESDKKFHFSEKKGDLFGCPDTDSLAHCISADIRMGKGIATIFKKKFGGIGELQQQGQKPGGCAILKRGKRYVYYLITKEKYWQKPTYETLKSSLCAMKKHCLENNVPALAMPRIGCGLDQLQWPKVLEILKETFGDTEIQITVYTL